MRGGRAEDKERERDRGATNDWLQESFSYEEKKNNKQVQN